MIVYTSYGFKFNCRARRVGRILFALCLNGIIIPRLQIAGPDRGTRARHLIAGPGTGYGVIFPFELTPEAPPILPYRSTRSLPVVSCPYLLTDGNPVRNTVTV